MAAHKGIPWRRWVTWFMATILVASLVTWFVTRDTLPEPIKLATAVEGGLYHELGQRLDELLQNKTGHHAVKAAGAKT